MVQCYGKIFSDAEMDYLLNHPLVQYYRERLDTKAGGPVSFSIPNTPSVSTILGETLGVSCSLERIPMRWIRGDTAAHLDRGTNPFRRTHLVYLTDSEGELIVGGDSYPIALGHAYSFPEGMSHRTVGTGEAPRLLLGPMSEHGLAVGVAQIGAHGGTTVYLRENNSGDAEYSVDQIQWDTLYWPSQVVNTDPSLGYLVLEWTTDMTLTNTMHFFYCGSEKIQFGSTYLKQDGTRPKITITADDYDGLIENGTDYSTGQNNISVFNLQIHGSTHSTQIGGGWFGKAYYGKGATGNYIVNCFSDGVIAASAGGIVGQYSGSGADAALTMIGCSSSGAIGSEAGGIGGSHVGTSGGSVTCKSCWTSGTIGTEGGGIAGKAAGSVFLSDCYSTGTVGTSAGGIVGSSCASGTIDNCYSTGSIASQAGGIAGASPSCVINNSYTTGNASSNGGGIVGSGGSPTITHCYTTGSVTSNLGYITAGSATVPSGCYSEAANSASGWSSVHANTALQGAPTATPVGTIWVASTPDQPYELHCMGYTPYTLLNIETTPTPTLVAEYRYAVVMGGSTNAAILSGKSYTILDKSGGNPSSYSTITLDGTSGTISTLPSTVPGEYTLVVRNTGSYNITSVILTVGIPCLAEDTMVKTTFGNINIRNYKMYPYGTVPNLFLRRQPAPPMNTGSCKTCNKQNVTTSLQNAAKVSKSRKQKKKGKF